jgi:hypothetical protein
MRLQPPERIEYAVRKDNSFSYRGNFYSLPAGTYQGRGSKVLLEKQGYWIVLYNLQQEELCRHLVSTGRGEKVINNHHRRALNPAIGELEELFCARINEPAKGRQLIDAIRSDKPRYIRDQLKLLLDVTEQYTPDIIRQTLLYCCEQQIRGAGDFKAVAAHYQSLQISEQEVSLLTSLGLNPLNRKLPDEALIQPATSSITDYNHF